jgi:hypothetical protein
VWSSLAGVLLALLAGVGCSTLDVRQPITLAPDGDWEPRDVAELERAAGCWNLQFGTRLQLYGDAAQQVRFSWSDFVCLQGSSPARTDPTLPVHVFICPPEYTYPRQRATVQRMTVLHELGHVLNIRAEGELPSSVMGWTSSLPHRFSEEDRALFRAANPGFTGVTAICEVAIWSVTDATQGTRLDCSCP